MSSSVFLRRALLVDAAASGLTGALMLAGPRAQRECKALIRAVAHQPIDAKVIARTVRHIATVRASRKSASRCCADGADQPRASMVSALTTHRP